MVFWPHCGLKFMVSWFLCKGIGLLSSTDDKFPVHPSVFLVLFLLGGNSPSLYLAFSISNKF